MKFPTVGKPATLNERNLLGRIIELHDRPCQAMKRNGEVCGRPSRQWMQGVGTRCWRHREDHACRFCVREVPA